MTTVRKGQAPQMLDRAAFHRRFGEPFADPVYAAEQGALDRVEEIAWKAYCGERKQPLTHPAGPGFADPDYALSDEWRAASERVKAAEARQKSAATPSRALVIAG